MKRDPHKKPDVDMGHASVIPAFLERWKAETAGQLEAG